MTSDPDAAAPDPQAPSPPPPTGTAATPDPQAPSPPPPTGTAATPDPQAPTPTAPADPAAPAAVLDEHRLHVAYVLVRALRILRGAIPAAIAIGIGLKGLALPIFAAVLVLLIVFVILEWRVTTYSVGDGALRLRHGVINRSERVVPASRISALDTSRGLIQRVFGLVSLEVQTAGGKKEGEIHLQTVTFEEAERLRAVLGHASPGHGPAGVPPGLGYGAPGTPDRTAQDGAPGPGGRGPAVAPSGIGAPDAPGRAGEPPVGPPPARHPRPRAGGLVDTAAAERRGLLVYAITTRELVVAALTGPQIGVVAVLIGSAASQLDDLLPDSLTKRAGDTVSSASATGVVLLVLAALVVAAAIAFVGTVLAYAEFTVTRDDRRLRVRRGLLTERTGTIPIDRIHGVRIVEGLLRRPLGYATVQVEVAGYSGEDELTRTLVPLVRRRELPELLERILPDLPWVDEPLRRPPPRAHRRYWTVPVLLAVLPAAAAAILLPGAWRLAAVVPLAAGGLLGEARWRGAGWALTAEALVLRWQLVARTTLLARPTRVQMARVQSNPFQRRADLAQFDVVLATRRHGNVRHLDGAVATDLLRDVVARIAVGRVDRRATPPERPH